MRLTALKESAPGQKGITTKADAEKWLEQCKNGEASANDMKLYGALTALYDELMTVSKQLGGKSTVMQVLSMM